MNRLTDALALVEDAGPAPVTAGSDASRGPAAFEKPPADALGATGNDADAESPAAASEEPPPDTMGAAGDDADAGAESLFAPPVAGPSAGWELGPIRATRDDVDPQAVALAFDSDARDDPASVRSSRPDDCRESGGGDPDSRESVASGSDAPCAPSDEPVPEHLPLAGEARSARHRTFDPRTLPRRSGIGRVAGITGVLVAVATAAAGGGYLLWSAEFTRPALVRRLPAMPAPIMELTPVHAANAATDGTEATVPGATARTGGLPPLPMPDVTQATEVPKAAKASRVPSSDSPSASDAPRRSPGNTAVALADSRGPSVSDASERSPQTTTVAPAVRAAVRAAAESSPDAVNRPAPASKPDAADIRPDPAAGIVIRKRVRADHVADSLRRAYEAFLAGDGESAARMYRTVLGHEPGNRDARLGLAAIAVRDGRRDEAAGHYARILAARPADTVARAALIAIDERSPTATQSRLKALLRSEPQAAHLHFILGSLYAAQSRWPEAQQSWFNAYRFDRGNADYAYNLAVSLDHLSQPRSALGLYREALALARTRPASFDAAAVRRRIRALDPPAQAGSTTVPPAPEAAAAAPSAPAARIR